MSNGFIDSNLQHMADFFLQVRLQHVYWNSEFKLEQGTQVRRFQLWSSFYDDDDGGGVDDDNNDLMMIMTTTSMSLELWAGTRDTGQKVSKLLIISYYGDADNIFSGQDSQTL